MEYVYCVVTLSNSVYTAWIKVKAYICFPTKDEGKHLTELFLYACRGRPCIIHRTQALVLSRQWVRMRSGRDTCFIEHAFSKRLPVTVGKQIWTGVRSAHTSQAQRG